MPFVDNFVCFCGQATFESFLELHIKDEAGGNQNDVSITFLIMGAVYMVSSLLAGYVRMFDFFVQIISMFARIWHS